MNYPKLNIKELPKLVTIVEQAASDEKYLDPSNCPYDEGTRNLIGNVLDAAKKSITVDRSAPERGKVGRPSKQPTIPLDEIEKELNEIREELGSLKIEGQTMETKDRIQVIKTRAALVERLLGMKTEIGGLKKFNSFVQNVIGIMQDHVEPKEREEILSELKKYVEQ